MRPLYFILSCLWAAGCQCAPKSSPVWPDLVFVTVDTTRADHLGVYGYLRDTSPHIDALAAQSIRFERLITPMATTLPAHATLFSGVDPLEHGILANVRHGGERFVPSPALRPLASLLQDAGYQTAGFVSAAVLRETTGIHTGFSVYNAPPGEERSAEKTVDRALDWLSHASTEAPYFLWVHLFDPHNPYRAPAPYTRRFQHDQAAVQAWRDERQIPATSRRPTGQDVDTVEAHDGYDAEIAFMDAQIGRLLDAIAARPRGKETVIVLVGDHGEGLGQHNEPAHGLIWDEQLHPPLIIHIPGRKPEVISRVLGSRDLLPTLVGLVDLPDKAAILAQSSGHDVLAADAPTPVTWSLTSERQIRFGVHTSFAMTTDTLSCHKTDTQITRYDLQSDPFQLHPLPPSEAQDTACAQAIDAYIAGATARGRQLGAGKTEPMSAKEIHELEQLGYVEEAPEGQAP